jgi:hypothetical protein
MLLSADPDCPHEVIRRSFAIVPSEVPDD